MSDSDSSNAHQLNHWVGGIVLGTMDFQDSRPEPEYIVELTSRSTQEPMQELLCIYIHNSLLTYDCWWYTLRNRIKQEES